jgi:hypothetical protein
MKARKTARDVFHDRHLRAEMVDRPQEILVQVIAGIALDGAARLVFRDRTLPRPTLLHPWQGGPPTIASNSCSMFK